MGGLTSDHHHEFRKQCYTAFLHLRRHANVMLNLFSLMVDASVPGNTDFLFVRLAFHCI